MPKKIIIAAGGTGGHIFPGIAIAEQLIAKGHTVEWIGTERGLEVQIVPKHGIKIHYIKVTGFRGKNWLTKLISPFKIIWAICQSIIILAKQQPDLVVGLGGFVTGPVGIASWLLRKKLAIHEQNAIAGTSNRILAYFANYVLESFPNSFPEKISRDKLTLFGNPIRNNLLQAIESFESLEAVNSTSDMNFASRSSGSSRYIEAESTKIGQKKLRILVLGGSRGARFLNQLIPTTLAGMPNVLITHQTGTLEYPATYNLYAEQNLQDRHNIKPFIEDMAQAYQNTDLIICRAGASTIFEIMAMGIPSILVPLPSAIDDHQTKNANYLVNNNAGILIKQSDLTKQRLRSIIEDLILNQNKLHAMQVAARQLYEQYNFNSSISYFESILG